MRGALLFIGDELIAGRILNTNAEFAGKVLSAAGFHIGEIVTIPDEEQVIIRTLKRLVEEYDFLIASGGLGPTDDDLTIEAISKAFNLKLIQNQKVLSAILSSKEYQNTTELAEKMSYLPEGAINLVEEEEMIGFYFTYGNKLLFFLPGVPYQFQYLLKNRVLSFLCKREEELKGEYACKENKLLKNLVFFDVNETDLNQYIATLSIREEVKIGYYPVLPEVKVVLFGAEGKVSSIIKDLKERFSLNFISEEDESLNVVVGKLLNAKGYTLSTAESCTGGLLASLITEVPGSSAYFDRGFIVYTEESKEKILGVSNKTLKKKGVYSYETAMEMAIGARSLAKTHFALATTGVAGPTGGTPEIPVGTVFIGLATPSNVYAIHFLFQGNRKTIQTLASFTALDILRRYILYGKGFFSYRFALGYKESTL
ncbi:MAG: nicotinamide-nucleotide amidohydrolase family protein [Caldimicrobium sp.]